MNQKIDEVELFDPKTNQWILDEKRKLPSKTSRYSNENLKTIFFAKFSKKADKV